MAESWAGLKVVEKVDCSGHLMAGRMGPTTVALRADWMAVKTALRMAVPRAVSWVGLKVVQTAFRLAGWKAAQRAHLKVQARVGLMAVERVGWMGAKTAGWTVGQRAGWMVGQRAGEMGVDWACW